MNNLATDIDDTYNNKIVNSYLNNELGERKPNLITFFKQTG